MERDRRADDAAADHDHIELLHCALLQVGGVMANRSRDNILWDMQPREGGAKIKTGNP
jgi:hypothetical protein